MPDNIFVHPQALCECEEVGAGTHIWAFAHVMPGARIGRDCNIGDYAFVESGAVIGDRVTIKNGTMVWDGVTIANEAFIGPGVVFSNDRRPRSPRAPDPAIAARYEKTANWLLPTHVEEGASLGAGAVVLCGIRIGSWAMVAAGSVVTHDVAAHACVAGQPARLTGRVCRCGAALDADLRCISCARAWRETNDGLVLA